MKRFMYGVAVAGVLIVLAGCSLMEDSTEAAGPTTPAAGPTSPSPEPTSTYGGPPIQIDLTPPTPVPTPVPIINYSWSDTFDYNYDLSLMPVSTVVSSDIANALPHLVNLTLTYKFSGTLHNDTGLHNAPSPDLFLAPVWSPASPLCGFLHSGPDSDVIQNVFSQGDVVGDWCTIDSMPLTLNDGSQAEKILADETVELSGEAPFKVTVREGDAPTMTALMEEPDEWVVGRVLNQRDFEVCTFADEGQRLSSPTVVVAATGDVGCGL